MVMKYPGGRGGSRIGTRMGRDSWRAVALVALITALKLNNGYYAPAAMAFLSLAIVALFLARQACPRPLSRLGWGVLIAVLSIENVSYAASFPNSFTPGVVAVVFGGVLAIMPVRARVRSLALGVAAVGMVELTTAHWRWGFSRIDVFYILQRGATQLLHGRNPYLARYTAGTGLHFTYGPATAILAAPAAWLGDARVMNLICFAAIVVAVGLLARRGGASGATWSGVVATTIVVPTTPLLITAAWTEVYPLAAICWWLVVRSRHRTIGIALLAIALAAKFTVLPAIVVLALWSVSLRREILWAAATSLAVYIPFAIWTGPASFVYDVAGVFGHLNNDVGSLSLNGAAQAILHATVPFFLSGAAGLLVLSWVGLHKPRDAADLLDAAALVSLVGFFLAKWAFFNYYIIPVVLLLVGFAFGRGLFGPPPDWLLPDPRRCWLGHTSVGRSQAARLSIRRRDSAEASG